MHAKLAGVVALLAYHLFCYRLMGQLEKGTCRWGGKQLRALNELPTLLLVLVVMLVVFKAQFPTGAATWFLVALVVFVARLQVAWTWAVPLTLASMLGALIGSKVALGEQASRWIYATLIAVIGLELLLFLSPYRQILASWAL
jgi:hypothetical protein